MIDSREFTELDALERIRAIDREYGSKALLLSSMQKTSSVLMHLIHRAEAKTVIFFGDTGFHFHETLAVRDEFIRRYGLKIVTGEPRMTPEEQRRKYGDRHLYLYVDGQPECCDLRKTKPYLKYARLKKIEAKLDGLMRAEGGPRAEIEPIGVEGRLQIPEIHPIFDWNEQQVDEYIKEHDVPVNLLHSRGYPSIGCYTCTTPVTPGEGKRAGRWRHLRADDGKQPEYCHINFTDLGSGI